MRPNRWVTRAGDADIKMPKNGTRFTYMNVITSLVGTPGLASGWVVAGPLWAIILPTSPFGCSSRARRCHPSQEEGIEEGALSVPDCEFSSNLQTPNRCHPCTP